MQDHLLDAKDLAGYAQQQRRESQDHPLDGPAYAGSSPGCEGPGWTGVAAVDRCLDGPA